MCEFSQKPEEFQRIKGSQYSRYYDDLSDPIASLLNLAGNKGAC
jgi:hypothetical protein